MRFARHLSAILTVMYGLVPLLVDLNGVYEAPYANINLAFSAVLLIFIYALPTKVKYFHHSFKFTDRRSTALTLIIFASSLYCFYLFPWHEDRESWGASLSAVFRALWFVVGVSYINSNERTRLLVMLGTVILMYIDQSRTYFLLLLIILAIRSDYKKLALLFGVSLAVVLGAVRSSDSGSGLDFLLYGIVGEGYNATRAVGQIYEASHMPIDTFSHLASTFFQPVTLPFDLLMQKYFEESYRLQDFYLSTLVDSYLSETFNPMGGWYITADFIYYGYFGFVLMGLYLYITWVFSRIYLDTKLFPFGAFFLFIAIKSNPFIYWKFVFYLIFISLAYKALTLLFNSLPSFRAKTLAVGSAS